MLMHCNQCEQTTKGHCCIKIGTCGKNPALAQSQDKLVATCVSAACCVTPDEKSAALLEKALFATLTNVNFDVESIEMLCGEVRALIEKAPTFDMQSIWQADEDVRSLKSLILFGLKGVAAYAYHARILVQRSLNNAIY